METDVLVWTMVAIVGTVGVFKNLIPYGGKKVWTLVTLVVGTGIATLAMYVPIEVLQVWVAVTGATLFYDTIFKSFQKLIESFSKMDGKKDSEEE